ncbi:MAG: hypothetical protein ACI4T1_04965 [Christensenellales bacterium]
MKKLKKICLALVICLITIFATGCANIQYQRVIYSDGTIIDAIGVTINEQKIIDEGFNIVAVKNQIATKMQGYLNTYINAFIVRDDNLNLFQKNTILNHIEYGVSEFNEENTITASIKFKNGEDTSAYTIFKYFYGLHLIEDEVNDENETVVEEFLYNKTITTGQTIFAGSDAQFVSNEFISYFDNKFTQDDVELYYIFGTPQKKLHSDADFEFTQDSVNYYQWHLSDFDDEIKTYTYQIKQVNWYLLALCLTFLLIIVLFIISLFQKKDKIVIKAQIINDENLENIWKDFN